MLAFYADVPMSLPAGHRFPQSKYRLLREQLERDPGRLRLQAAPPAGEAELLRVHTPRYVDAVLYGRLTVAELREIGFPWSPGMPERARRSVGATLAAGQAALREGVAANLGGGTHHAYADKGSGYCVFNDVAVAARQAQASWGVGRVLVIDLDVHQGNGTAAIFRGDPSVFTFSMHGARNFPFRKEAGSLDVELPDGCGDVEYLASLDGAMRQVWQQPLPDLAFYLAGADPHEGDRLGRLKLTFDGLAERDRRVLDALRARRIPVAVCMAGGYGQDVTDTVQVQLTTLRLAAESWTAWRA